MMHGIGKVKILMDMFKKRVKYMLNTKQLKLQRNYYVFSQHKVIITSVVFIILISLSRIIFCELPQVKPVIALAMFAGLILKSKNGFLVGALSMFISNFFFGQGPWTLWQMLALGIVSFITPFFKPRILNKKNRTTLFTLGVIMSYTYSLITNLGFLLMTNVPVTLKSYLLANISSFSMDLILICSTEIFLNIILQFSFRLPTKYISKLLKEK